MLQQSDPIQSVPGLGPLRSVHHFSRFFRNNRFILSGLILMGIFSCMCMLVYGLTQDALNGVQSEGVGTTLTIAAFMILLALFIIFWMMRDWLKNRNYRAALYQNGVAIQDNQGKLQYVSWQDIEYMRANRLPGSRYSNRTLSSPRFYNYNLVCRDGRILVLPHFLEGLSELVKAVKLGLGQQA